MESICLIVDDFAPIDDVMEVGADEIVESYGHFVDEMIADEKWLAPTNHSFRKTLEQFRREHDTDYMMSVVALNEESLFDLYNQKVGVV